MKSDPFTIKIYVPNGDPESVRIVELMNWTGKGIVFSRLEWSQISQREEFNQAGIYFLTGQKDEDDLPTLYIGQTDVLRERINKRKEEKDFWDRAIIFVSSNNSLNRGHITWLEYALLKQAKEVAQCLLDNLQFPQRTIAFGIRKSRYTKLPQTNTSNLALSRFESIRISSICYKS
jgi:hypothetical protein